MKRVTVKTETKPGGLILQSTLITDCSYEELMRRTVQTENAQVREALINLGWIPPEREVTWS